MLRRDPANVSALRLIAADVSALGEVSASTEADTAAETLRRLEAELADLVPPMFVSSEPGSDGYDAETVGEAYDAEAVGAVRLADVAGMEEVKARLEA